MALIYTEEPSMRDKRVSKDRKVLISSIPISLMHENILKEAYLMGEGYRRVKVWLWRCVCLER